MKKIVFILGYAFSDEEEKVIRALIAESCTSAKKKYEVISCKQAWKRKVRAYIHNDEISKLVAVGGDGTVNMVAQLVVNTNVPLGIIPKGTANILAKTMEIPLGLKEAIERIVSSEDRVVIDGLKIDKQYFFTHITIGLSSYITKETAATEKKTFGFLAYFAKGFQKVLTVPFHRFYLSVDGVMVKKRAVDLVVANIPLFLSTRFILDRSIKMDDGLMAVVILRPRFLKDFVALFFRFLSKKKTTLGQEVFSKFKAKELKITNHKPLPVHADGEIIGKTPVTITVVPGCLVVVR